MDSGPKATEKSPLLSKCDHQRKSLPTRRTWHHLPQFSGISVEPAFFLMAVAYGIDSVNLSSFWVDRVCRSLYSKGICEHLQSGNYSEEQDTVQRLVGKYKSTFSHWIECVPAIFVVLILGAWSDVKDRKLPVVLPQVGVLCKYFILVIFSYYGDTPPLYLLIASVPVGFSGGILAFFLGFSSYLAATVSFQSRTLRFGLMNVLMLVAVPVGRVIATAVYAHFGYGSVFCCQSVIVCLGVIYSVLRLEKHPGVDLSSGVPKNKVGLLEMLSPVRMKRTLSVPFKKRQGGLRTQILGHIFIIAGLLFDSGVTDFHYLYVRKKFGWDYYAFATWSELSTPVAGIGTVFLVPILSYKYGVEDAVLCLMGTMSYMFMYIVIGTASFGWMMYLAIGLSIFSGMCFISMRGGLSKLVPKEELGAIFAVVALGETIMPIVNGPFFTFVYNATLDVFPGTIYVISAGMFALLGIACSYLLTRPNRPRQKVLSDDK
ncbi:probable peptidoglycan muropeptide transporter SLC46 [Macrobrachium nipponense]|uniref:probable peptidoglycan muropeptide transporter SLC46 n=1 Tax=Macrobrachium nipponense TaxID=159736 RepID=UPI0030C81A49